MAQGVLQVMRQRCRPDERIFEGYQFTRPNLLQRNARCNTLHIAGAFELFAQSGPDGHAALGGCAVVVQLIKGGQTFYRNLPVARRIEQPLFELTAAHACHASV